MKTFRICAACAAGLLAAPLSTAAQVTASLAPDTIALGDSAQLTVTLSGNNNSQPELPAVNGLEFTPVGQSSSFQSVNGAVTASVSLMYQVTPDRAGLFTIPAIRLPGGGSSQPLTLRVLKSSGGTAALSPPSLPPPAAGLRAAQGAENPNGAQAFLRVVIPKEQLYVGELVPVQIKAYFRAGMSASLNGLPVLSSEAFTLNQLSEKPTQTQETVRGLPYVVVTWSSALAAVKTGDYSVNLELPVVVRVQERGRRGSNPFRDFFGDSDFGDSMFDDFFGRVTEKPLTLRGQDETIKVVALPSAGRPADFSGAVGKFDLSSEAAPTQLTAGDPITLRLKVSGEGNFDRVYSRGLETSAEWKTYPAKGQFEPADTAGYAGAKTFEQAVIPLKAGEEKIPAITFSYFDPDERHYVTRATRPIQIEVAPGSSAQPLAALPNPSTAAPPSPSANPSSSQLAPNQVETGEFVTSLRPVLFAPWFVAAQGVPVLALVAGLVVGKRRERLARDPLLARNRASLAAVREHLAVMDEALAENRAPEFFTAARQAMQEQLARRWQLSPNAVTPAEIVRRLNGGAGDLQALFALADDVVYSGRNVPPADLRRWNDSVRQQLKHLEKR